jgi:thiamine biosynthesis lipoprotein
MAETLTTERVREAHLRVMGSDAHLVLVGGDPLLLDDARAHLELLEARWSRFRPSSELSRLNASPGRPVTVSLDTFAVISRAVEAWRLTNGRFDPTVLPALRAPGDDRDFAVITHDGPVTTAPRGRMPAPGCAGIALDATVGAVTLPEGVVLDLGGIAKGFAADRVATALLAAGADGACVNLGGDLRVVGRAPEGSSWTIDVDDPFESGTGTLLLAEGAVATSSRLRRAWRRGEPAHRLIEPATGASARTGLASVTVVAGEAWWAEVLAKAAFVAGPEVGAALVSGAGATGLLVRDDGRVEELLGLDAFRPHLRAAPLNRA